MSAEVRLPRANPSSLGVDASCICALLDAVEERGILLHSLMVARQGTVCVDLSWSPYHSSLPHSTHSLTKSAVGMLAGCLFENGFLSPNDLVLDLLPEYRDIVADPTGRLARLRVSHLLDMTSGHLSEPPKQGVDDELLAFLEAPMEAEPGERFFYTSAGVNALSALFERTSGTSLHDLLASRVLGPIGIDAFRLERCVSGCGKGSGGLILSPEAITRICLLLLQDGRWGDQQVLPIGWAERLGAPNVLTPLMAGPTALRGTRQGYGNLVWCCPDEQVRILYGLNGQFGIVFDSLDAVVVTTAAEPDATRVLDLVWEFVVPAISPDVDAPTLCDASEEMLCQRAAMLSTGWPSPDEMSSECACGLWSRLSDLTLCLPENRDSLLSPGHLRHIYTSRSQEAARNGIERLSLAWDDGKAVLSYVESGVSGTLEVGTGGNAARGILHTLWGDVEVLAAARWLVGDTLELRVQPVESEYWQTLTVDKGVVTFGGGPER